MICCGITERGDYFRLVKWKCMGVRQAGMIQSRPLEYKLKDNQVFFRSPVPIGRGLSSSYTIAAPNALLFSLSLGDWLEHHDESLLTPYGTNIHADDQALDRGGNAVARMDFENILQKICAAQ